VYVDENGHDVHVSLDVIIGHDCRKSRKSRQSDVHAFLGFTPGVLPKEVSLLERTGKPTTKQQPGKTVGSVPPCGSAVSLL
jgi:hypothetical protein